MIVIGNRPNHPKNKKRIACKTKKTLCKLDIALHLILCRGDK